MQVKINMYIARTIFIYTFSCKKKYLNKFILSFTFSLSRREESYKHKLSA
jgi:hypothetical protein